MNRLDLERLELREIKLPLKAAFETSFGTAFERRILLVRVCDKDGTTGNGECTAFTAPIYNHETTGTARTIISEFIVPMLSDKKIERAADVSRCLSSIRGNRMAISAVETAIWDLEAKKAKTPLWRHLGGTQEQIDCGVSIGLHESPEILLEKVKLEVESGYQRIKLKIKPGQDVELVKKIRSHFPEIQLSVDANSAYDFDKDLGVFEEIDDFDLLMIEQPLAAGDLVDHAKLQRHLKTPICLDESITLFMDARHAFELGACRIFNIKLGRVGGHAEARKIQSFAMANAVPVWCGGMLETGIGRAHNIAMSTLEGFTLPGDVSASARYWEEDIIEPPVTVSSDGTIIAPKGPGIGFELKDELIETLTIRRESINLKADRLKMSAGRGPSSPNVDKSD